MTPEAAPATPPLCVIVPTRSRPDNVFRLAYLWAQTSPNAHLSLVFDDDDPLLEASLLKLAEFADTPRLGVSVNKSLGAMVPALNHQAIAMAQRFPYIGFMGDDHYPRTDEWADMIVLELSQPGVGIVYGNDGFQGPNLPTAVFMRSSIVQALGYMAPPFLKHMAADNAWRDWGSAAWCLRYLSDVSIEHLHPEAGKADEDERYGAVRGLMGEDMEAYLAYRDSPDFARDVQLVRGAL